MKEISIACAFKNEEECLPWLLACVDDLGDVVKDAVFVDDESNDKSTQIIKEWSENKDFPVTIITNKLEAYNKQKNIALENCTGNWILFVDADMTWTKNFRELFLSGYFNTRDIWDFPLYYTILDKYHYSVDSNTAAPTTRFFRGNKGFRYQWEVHEHIMYPEDVVGLDYSTEEGRRQGFEYTHKPNVLGICPSILFFENSMILSDEALLARGQRRMAWLEKSEGRGITFDVNTYLTAKHRPDDPADRAVGTRPFTEEQRRLIT